MLDFIIFKELIIIKEKKIILFYKENSLKILYYIKLIFFFLNIFFNKSLGEATRGIPIYCLFLKAP
jgi:hypothetical protein